MVTTSLTSINIFLAQKKKMDKDTDASFPKSNSSVSPIEASVPKMVGNQTLTRTGELCSVECHCPVGGPADPSPLTQVTAV